MIRSCLYYDVINYVSFICYYSTMKLTQVVMVVLMYFIMSIIAYVSLQTYADMNKKYDELSNKVDVIYNMVNNTVKTMQTTSQEVSTWVYLWNWYMMLDSNVFPDWFDMTTLYEEMESEKWSSLYWTVQ